MQGKNVTRKSYQIKPVKHFTVAKDEKKTIVVEGTGTYVIKLTGENANAVIVGALRIKGKDIVKIHTIQHHKAPHTTSDLLIKAVLADRGRLEYDGLIKIDKKAMHANAYQRQENLLLSDEAHVESKPELEIGANEVRCTHGATMGMIDEDQVFYLMSRGLSRPDSEGLIVEGFLASALERVGV